MEASPPVGEVRIRAPAKARGLRGGGGQPRQHPGHAHLLAPLWEVLQGSRQGTFCQGGHALLLWDSVLQDLSEESESMVRSINMDIHVNCRVFRVVSIPICGFFFKNYTFLTFRIPWRCHYF